MTVALRISCVVAISFIFPCICGYAATPSSFKLETIIQIPGEPLGNFDIGFVDPANHRYYFADRTNKSVEVIDLTNNKFLYHLSGFTGSQGDKALAKTVTSQTIGPNGVLVIPDKHQVWAGNGDSHIKVFDTSANPPKLIADINTGGKNRVDEMDYDPKENLVVATNDTDSPPFVSFISVASGFPVLGKLEIPDATDGIEQPRYNTRTGMIYQSVPSYKGQKSIGGFAVIDPRKRTIDHMILVDNCSPAGNVQGPGDAELMACQDPKQTVIVNVATGKVIQSIPQVGGIDEAWYDEKSSAYYLSARDNPSGPVLGVIDAATNKWIANVPTAKNSHSVAVDPDTGRVYVPMLPNPVCTRGCVAVFAPQ
ncbi:MAG TPA: hypothetical protein VL574_17285 [Stellaceae bacterium]|jgi:DNA-binding beta-propeller fold protein YncE|nr:hypothetical protein [Stellaceae bacterium]